MESPPMLRSAARGQATPQVSAAATDTLPGNSYTPRVLELTVLKGLGIGLPKTAKILDFGCGAGRTLRSLRALGYTNTYGYDVADGRTLLGVDRSNISIGSLFNLKLPYEDNTFDL